MSGKREGDDSCRDACSVLKRSKRTPNITKLQLEAIFHPKFENEKSDAQIRHQMLSYIAAKQGYLEVSLKHSGSLVLWSGRQCFYSKNSTNNAFTMVGEILLMKHFARCYGIEKWQLEYDRCSEYVYQNRLTCSFEVVTSMLGQHGDVPTQDYLILIAIADRGNGGRFFSTNELITFSHRYRLPHNDVWIFNSKDASEQCFEAYDCLREEGTTTKVINRLDQIIEDNRGKCSKAASLYPHDVFQGSILEGIVIRYVNRNDDESTISEMEQLRVASEDLLVAVPPSISPLVPTQQSREDLVVETDLRALAGLNDFELQLREVLHKHYGTKQRQLHTIDGKSEFNQSHSHSSNVTNLSSEILRKQHNGTADFDQTTIQLAQLINVLDTLNINVTYRLFKEKSLLENSCDRCLCIIHVHHDESFQTYNKYLVREGCQGMALFRGFVIEIIADNNRNQRLPASEADGVIDRCMLHTNREENLMLKMKFLPYMVRTFICRNGLSILQSSGVAAFEQYAVGQLSRWKVSQVSMKKWLSFFKCWSTYCTSPAPAHLPPLTSKTYLQHYKECDKMYASDHFCISTAEACLCRGIIIIVGISRDEQENLIVAASRELRCQRIVRGMSDISERDILLSIYQHGSSLICSASIEDDLGHVRKLSKHYSNAISVVHVGNNDDDFEQMLVQMDIDDNRRKKLKGMGQAWRKVKCNNMLQLPKEAVAQPDIDATISFLRSDSTAKKVMETIATLNQIDDRPGLIVYFPSIPGSGKSALCRNIGEKTLASSSDRSVIVREGDAVKGKFYNEIEKELLTHRVAILDKNVPPMSFSSIHNLCSVSNCISAAVVPAGLQDTIVGGDVYPFSLEFLAACMNRVLSRNRNSHIGKLDSATSNCCMIVVKFYCFYRNISVAMLKEKLLNVGAANDAIEIPFFKKHEVPYLPRELKLSLERAISILARDLNNTDVADVESAMRLALQNNEPYFNDLTTTLEQTKEIFHAKLSKIISCLPDKMENAAQMRSPEVIKIVSLDFDYKLISSVLEKVKKTCSNVEAYFDERHEHESADENDTTLNRYIHSVHCTFAHKSQVTQSEMKALFNHLIGSKVDAKAFALLYSDKVAAIEVEIPEVTSDAPQHSIPRPRNTFQHVTVWCSEDTEAKESNELPDLINSNVAKKVLFREPIPIRGSFSFWYDEGSSI